ncbi:hypothetical protein DS909_08940 [Phaeobacter gallaeciensis]|uniref:Phytanoyl-CoA dioxygenase n=2 Tax=Roseobacteraceae TaxID=2854170 RepID=A0A366X5A2_9RHOB|nr:hypothetical protein [Phaeobacter gallaeciensis]MBT3139926.1 hypothetical protein [Falsiruegeria litorea]MBT8170270.1 hypothetical protein [Falsiruegeria litorea]RBW56820.1 hypothetical protein DS909_08940 [Phaeobacter gallaeciensis]
MVTGFWQRGWVQFGFDPLLADWAAHALVGARGSLDDPAHAQWLDCEGTWFIGVDALDNDAVGAVRDSGPLRGDAIDFIQDQLTFHALHKAQVSVMYPGYPRPRRGEGEAAFGYRLRRDAAHVDGLKPIGPNRERCVDEPHAWILGIPLSQASPDAAPLVVWDGSHKIMQAALKRALSSYPPAEMSRIDVTAIYQAARRKVFDTCPRIELPVRPGEAYVLHRHTLHGVAPWSETATAGPDGRMIAYFRPELPGGVAEWIETP